MRRQLVRALMLTSGFWLGATAPIPAAGSLTGTWNVHIQHMSGRTVDEQWIIDQTKNKLTGKVKTASREFPLEGTAKAAEVHIVVKVTQDRVNVFVGTLAANTIKGTIMQKGDDGVFSATRDTSH